jgi:hypothetical protein
MKPRKTWITLALTLAVAVPALAQTTITKPPDLGEYWQPLSPNEGTYVYANSFIAPPADLLASELGTWLLLLGGEGPEGVATRQGGWVGEGEPTIPTVRFEIWGEDAGGPDAGTVHATTGSLSLAVTAELAFFSAPVSGVPVALVPGARYWFAATVVGETGTGAFQTGGHTQNSVYADDGTFWYSNDPAGVLFDGQNLTPEMAFQVVLGEEPPPPPPSVLEIPTAGGWGLVLLGLLIAAVAVLAVRRF